jgi:HD-GYP domain-containing protein (c-di-GMP phosphodiesterase class II)
MKKIGIKELAGTYLSEPVFLDSGYILSSPDIQFSRPLHDRLAAWGFTSVFTEGEIVPGPPIASSGVDGESAEIAHSHEDDEGKQQAHAFFKKAVGILEDSFRRFREKDELRITGFTDLVKETTVELKDNRRFMLSLDDTEAGATSYITTHSVKTCILSLALADYLKIPPFRQIDIGLAGLLHEIGLMKIPEELYLAERSLTAQEKQTLMAHPVLGYRILKQAGFPTPTRLAVLEHNERIDGSGFPRKITGEKISEYGRILAVASSYHAATSPRPYKTGSDGHAGLMDLLKNAGRRYDEKVLGALLYTLSLYPIGTYLKMSNNSVGLVVKSNPDDPKHPLIKLIIDDAGVRLVDQPVVQTREGDEIRIVAALTKEEVVAIASKK